MARAGLAEDGMGKRRLIPESMILPLVIASALFLENMDSTVLATSLPAIAIDLGIDRIVLKLAFKSCRIHSHKWLDGGALWRTSYLPCSNCRFHTRVIGMRLHNHFTRVHCRAVRARYGWRNDGAGWTLRSCPCCA